MLNYIWAGLIVFSLVFAMANDVRDLRNDTFRNGKSLPVMIEPPNAVAGQSVTVRIDQAAYQSFYGTDEKPGDPLPAKSLETKNGREIHFASTASLPPRLTKIREATTGEGTRDLFGKAEAKSLLSVVTRYDPGATATVAEIRFPSVRWATIQAIGNAAINMSRVALELSLTLVGTLALFLGIMQIAEKSGLLNAVVIITGPILRPLFPGIPKGHPAMAMVTLNLTANMLGLGNAATPFGIKAMEELQKLNKSTDTATNGMVMLLAMNTAGVQLLPPMMLYGVMGLRASELYFPILIVTGLCLIIAIITTKLLEKLPGYRASDPDRLPATMEVT